MPVWLMHPLVLRVALPSLAVLVLVAAIYWRGRGDEAQQQEAREVREVVREMEVRRDVDTATDREPEPARRLLDQWSRD
jgi:hypothetical protein